MSRRFPCRRATIVRGSREGIAASSKIGVDVEMDRSERGEEGDDVGGREAMRLSGRRAIISIGGRVGSASSDKTTWRTIREKACQFVYKVRGILDWFKINLRELV